jgi:ATP-binding cassette subfamily C (CFTR/MRP) protein 10
MWETHFELRINAIRERELYYLKVRKYLDAVCVYLWASAPLLISVAIFATYTLAANGILTAAKVSSTKMYMGKYTQIHHHLIIVFC